MLREILKGMDNGAEAINDNFQNGAVVESGKNDKGDYTRFGDGRQICVSPVIDLPRVYTNVCQGQWIFPRYFVDEEYSISIEVISINSTSAPDSALGIVRASTRSVSTVTLRQVAIEGYTFSGSDSIKVKATAIGRWKE